MYRIESDLCYYFCQDDSHPPRAQVAEKWQQARVGVRLLRRGHVGKLAFYRQGKTKTPLVFQQ